MTTRQLVLVRHSKAVGDDGPDIRRPLAKRGQADARALGRWLADQALNPDRVVVSPARRAQQTWQHAAAELQDPPEPVVDERIYANRLDDVLAVVRDTPAAVGTLVLVGHNPSLQTLAVALDAGTGDATARRQMADRYPTSGVAVFGLTVDWSLVGPGAGRLTGFVAPRG